MCLHLSKCQMDGNLIPRLINTSCITLSYIFLKIFLVPIFTSDLTIVHAQLNGTGRIQVVYYMMKPVTRAALTGVDHNELDDR